MKKFGITLIVCFCLGKMFAQNTSSPYSIIGLGDIEKSFFDRTSGLGHAGVALHNDRYFFVGNPASFSFLEKTYQIESSSLELTMSEKSLKAQKNVKYAW